MSSHLSCREDSGSDVVRSCACASGGVELLEGAPGRTACRAWEERKDVRNMGMEDIRAVTR